jgi:hypothetical protein
MRGRNDRECQCQCQSPIVIVLVVVIVLDYPDYCQSAFLRCGRSPAEEGSEYELEFEYDCDFETKSN